MRAKTQVSVYQRNDQQDRQQQPGNLQKETTAADFGVFGFHRGVKLLKYQAAKPEYKPNQQQIKSLAQGRRPAALRSKYRQQPQ